MSEFIVSTTRIAQDNLGKIRTFTGKYVDPFNMTAGDLDIRDIAHHLSQINRYTGAAPIPYSVAQHSVAVSRHFVNWEMRLAGLLHDAGEAYLNDIASPLKKHPCMAGYVEALDRLDALVFVTYGLDPALLKATRGADDAEFTYEVASFWGKIDYKRMIRPLPAAGAERLFLEEFAAINAMKATELQDTGT
jgi:hypothetical protein